MKKTTMKFAACVSALLVAVAAILMVATPGVAAGSVAAAEVDFGSDAPWQRQNFAAFDKFDKNDDTETDADTDTEDDTELPDYSYSISYTFDSDTPPTQAEIQEIADAIMAEAVAKLQAQTGLSEAEAELDVEVSVTVTTSSSKSNKNAIPYTVTILVKLIDTPLADVEAIYQDMDTVAELNAIFADASIDNTLYSSSNEITSITTSDPVLAASPTPSPSPSTAPPVMPSPSPGSDDDDDTDDWVIIAIVLGGCLGGVGLVAFLCWFFAGKSSDDEAVRSEDIADTAL